MNEREKAVALYTFLKEFAQLRTSAIRDISSYERDGAVLWISGLPRESGCYCIAWERDPSASSDEEVWLEIRKPRLTQPPEPPNSLLPWVRRDQLGDSSLDLPELYETLLGESPDDPPLRLEDHPGIRQAWDAYIESQWWDWADRNRRERQVSEVYTAVFSMFQRQQRLGENFEVVFGLGLLNWRPADGPMARRHLIAARVSVRFDRQSGTLTVVPAGEGARPSFEQDMLDPHYRPDPQELIPIEKALEDIGDSVWDVGPLDGLLKSWVNSASPNGEYSATLDPPERPDDTPIVHLAPALILRRRTERSFIRAFDEIIDQIDAGKPVPEGLSRFLSVSQDRTSSGPSARSGNENRPSETFFPLPANDAQRQIVERLATNQGVLVQGPPGTGKSHTIVNLICHALATGQRVLVTSHAPRALKVLQQMIRERAPDLAALSVVLLGDDREALLAMEESVHGITTRQNTWDRRTSKQTIGRLEMDLDKARRREAEVLANLRAIREQETLRHDAKFGYTGTLARIAGALYSEQGRLAWLPGGVPGDREPPLTPAEFGELVSLLRNERVSEWEAAGWVSVNTDALPSAEQFDRAVRTERAARNDYDQDASIRLLPEYIALRDMSEHHRDQLMDGLDELFRLIERIERRPLSWTDAATRQILGGLDSTWRLLHRDTTGTVESADELAGWLDRNPIDPYPSSNPQLLYGDAKDLLDHFRNGGTWGFPLFRAPVVKRAIYVRKLRVGGRLCETADTLSDLVTRLRAELEFMQLRERWAPHHAITATTFADQVAELKAICEPLEEAFAALTVAARLSHILSSATVETRVHGMSGRESVRPSRILSSATVGLESDWSDPDYRRRWREAVDAFESTRRYEAAQSNVDATIRELDAQRSHRQLDPTAEEFKTALTERDTSRYAGARQRIEQNRELESQLNRKLLLLRELQDVVPKLAEVLMRTPGDPVWDERAVNFDQAWDWSRARAWVTCLAAPDAERQQRLELENIRSRIARTIEQLAAEEAWAHCFSRMTEPERQHLVAWSKAVRAIGRGKGKFAAMHRRNAREHLNESRSAIPAWVMPLHRVAETIRPGSDLFDIAIIDEASQSGPEALLLAYMAKKIVVVGDDKQIHPTYAGVNFEDVNQIRERYISGLPHADAYGVNQSFFDLAEIRYEGRIRLREHFRCMPEIIQFSNNLSYQGEPLIPLRQYGAGRLEPTVVTRHVGDGYIKGIGARQANPAEAEAIVAEIVRIHADPSYANKTIGVISLVGEVQARSIETRLIQELGPEEMERRQIVCGDAYAFQGDERDVMFLSLVSAPRQGRRIPAMTDAAAQRRFNVSASRARDQMYLFHTATLADLNPLCVRYQLLEYCLGPKVTIPDVAGLDIHQLEHMASQADRQHVSSPQPFESWFELDVFLRIVRRGYRVIPQFEVGGYRIDLVVQGLDGSLAVECDGDVWHGPDRYDADVGRQRDLERCGWEFWRIRESEFRLDPDEALDDLWKTLERRQVFPKAHDEERRRAKRQIEPSGDLEPNEQANESESSRRPVDLFGTSVPPSQTELPSVDNPVQPSLIEPTSSGADAVDWLAPYREWQPVGPVPDPRTAEQDQLIALVTDIAKFEGPVVAIRAYRLINRASGSRRLTAPARRALNRACAKAVREGVLVATNPLDSEGQAQLVLRGLDSSAVILRERGPRELDELPPDELASMLTRLREDTAATDPETLKRELLQRLNWVRLTKKVSDFLDRCMSLI